MLGGGKERCSANFDYAGPLTESVLIGNVAARFPGETLEFDAARLRFTNQPDANQYLTRPIGRTGLSRHDVGAAPHRQASRIGPARPIRLEQIGFPERAAALAQRVRDDVARQRLITRERKSLRRLSRREDVVAAGREEVRRDRQQAIVIANEAPIGARQVDGEAPVRTRRAHVEAGDAGRTARPGELGRRNTPQLRCL